MFQIFRNKKLIVIYYIISSAILVYITFIKSEDSIFQTTDGFGMESIVPCLIVLIGNIVLTTFLFILKENIFAIFEIQKTKDAYTNARNRVQFFKKNEVVCLEGTIESQDPNKFLYTPITKQKTVAFSYGNPQVSGGIEQIPSSIKPSGENVPMNGLLSFDYFPENKYDPKLVNLSHFREYVLQKKSVTTDVNSLNLGYIMNTFPKLNSSSIHNTVPSFTDELFLNNSYTEKYIPYGIYGWVVGKWGDKKELLPLKFSNRIFVIEKNYRKNFYEYISQQSKKYIGNTIKIGVIILFILTIFIFAMVF